MNTHTPFESAVTQHGDSVLRVCRALLGSHTDAEDAWSETFLAALNAWPSLPENTRISGWLVTIAHHKSVDILRARTRQAHAVTRLAVPDAAPPGPEHTPIDLYRALARLTARQRTAVALHHLGGLPFAEIATELDCSPEAARRASADGMRALRTLLSDPVPNGSHS